MLAAGMISARVRRFNLTPRYGRPPDGASCQLLTIFAYRRATAVDVGGLSFGGMVATDRRFCVLKVQRLAAIGVAGT